MSVTEVNPYIQKETSYKQTLWRWSENYLCLGKKRYCVTNNFRLQETVNKDPWYLTALKVLSYGTLILPLLSLVLRTAFRKRYNYAMKIPSPTPQSSIHASLWFEDLDKRTRRFEISEVHKTSDVAHRFTNVCCPKATAVKKEAVGGKQQILHANHVKMEDGSHYIATQAPTSDTQELFWKVCLANKSKLLVDLTNDKDRANDPSVVSYYPEEKGDAFVVNAIKVTCVDKQERGNITISTYSVYDAEKEQTETVTRIHYRGWADFGAAKAKELDDLITLVDSANSPIGDGPITVHCRAGVGRTGSFITARTLKHLKIQGQLLPENFQRVTQKIILSGREQRGPLFVQSEEQLQGLIDFNEKLAKHEQFSARSK